MYLGELWRHLLDPEGCEWAWSRGVNSSTVTFPIFSDLCVPPSVSQSYHRSMGVLTPFGVHLLCSAAALNVDAEIPCWRSGHRAWRSTIPL